MMLPHWPFLATPDSPDWDPTMWRDEEKEPGNKGDNKYWAGFVNYTDKMVGKVVAKLDETGLRENTLVIFTCDNGTYTGLKQEFLGRIVKGGKGHTIDDGTHVPFIASWPGKIAAGKVNDELVDFSDILPTLADFGKAPIPDGLPADGNSLVATFLDKPHVPRDAIYCWYERDGIRNKASQHARTDRYKLYATGKFFDTHADPLEENDLAASKIPDELSEIHSALKAALAPRIAETAKFDPIQSARTNALKWNRPKGK
jgi:arylsulfatase A